MTARRCSTLKNSLARNTIIKIIVKVVLLVGLYKGGIMKGYLFGLGAMIVGSVVFWFFMLRTIFLILSPWDDLNKETSNIGQFKSVGKK